ncbi:MOSC domain-containing protein YiiM [Glaciihabitans tibetensis]|uniref:MOSC domain-containing protein YiiM n=1 Tax=Glaciihabitans tibetensis TaxID=1266600 RepID=A0A2T0VJT8_9MICO|nr:MOSC domain-containing protein [Glaciihabitans tibetensis]PRY70496.1 MOSC domain-containing protein YiiM [Glaciihabitans tibetensis]
MSVVPTVVSVGRDDRHRFSKPPVSEITLVAGIGIEGDAHAGPTVQHRYLKKKDPTARNLTQVHLIAVELFADLAIEGFTVGPGDLGENVTTSDIDLITLPTGTLLHLGPSAVVEITGLRSPCSLINRFQSGLMKACITRDTGGRIIRKAGIMAIVLASGPLRAGDGVRIELPAGLHVPLGVV